MDRNIITDASILDASARDQIPVITDPEQAEALLRALIEALSSRGNVQAEFRAGSLWDRKGYDTAGDFSPLVAPSPYRDPNGDDEVYLSVSVQPPTPPPLSTLSSSANVNSPNGTNSPNSRKRPPASETPSVPRPQLSTTSRPAPPNCVQRSTSERRTVLDNRRSRRGG